MPAGNRRRVCEVWACEALENAPGVDTPFATFYNAYIQAHPEAYLDIAQVIMKIMINLPIHINKKHKIFVANILYNPKLNIIRLL